MTIEDHLRKHGWYPGRKVEISGIPDSYPMDLKEFLSEFGGLELSHFPSDISQETFLIDPKLCDDYHLFLAEEFKRDFYPIGRKTGEAADIVLDDKGFLYLIGDVVVCYGQGLRQSFYRLLRIEGQRNSLAYNFSEKIWEDIFRVAKDFSSYDFDENG